LFVVLFVITDLVLGRVTIMRSERMFHPYFHHTFARNATFTEVWGDQKYVIHTNSLGFKDERIRNVPLEAEPGKTRVVLLGDSFTEGIGLPYEQTLAGLVQRRLGTERFEILNAGIASYSPRAYYLKMRYLLEQEGLRLHHLVVFVDISDVRDEIAYKGFQPQPRSSVSREADFFLKNHSFAYVNLRPRLRQWYEQAQIIRTYGRHKPRTAPDAAADASQPLDVNRFLDGRDAERSRWTFDDNVFEKWGRAGVALAVSNMAQLVDLCKRRRIALTIAVYPWPDQILRHDLESRQVSVWRTFAAEHGVGFINYFPDFIGDGDAVATVRARFIKGDSHWNTAGHRVIADRLETVIRERDATTIGAGAEGPPQ
jgi:lysophospholipase L1-like esterase